MVLICLPQVDQISPKRTGMLCNSDNLQLPRSGVSKRILSDCLTLFETLNKEKQIGQTLPHHSAWTSRNCPIQSVTTWVLLSNGNATGLSPPTSDNPAIVRTAYISVTKASLERWLPSIERSTKLHQQTNMQVKISILGVPCEH